jgi:hypothetical protein
MPRKTKVLANIDEKETEILLEEPDDDVETLEAPKIVEPPVKKEKKKINITSQDRERRIKQLQDIHEKRRLEKPMREEQKQKQKEEERKQLEEKIVKKAISIKKKQIKKQAILNDISDDETPIEVIQKIRKQSVRKEPVVEQPKYYFV